MEIDSSNPYLPPTAEPERHASKPLMPRRSTAAVLFICAWVIVGPFVITSAYLFFSRWPSYMVTSESDFVFLALSVLVGVVGVFFLPLPLLVRPSVAIAYLPIMAYLQLMYSLCFIGVVFGHWL
jgi:hypothetical protein